MSAPARSVFWNDRTGVLPAAVLALLPLLLWHRHFGELFWFGDEWDMIDQVDRLGLWRYIWLVFAENLVPIAKLVWGAAFKLSGGSYFVMLLGLWLTHAANVWLLGRVLRRAGGGWFATLLAQVVLALTPANIEALGWSAVWSAVLATTFLLFAFDSLLQWWPDRPGPGRRQLGWLVAFAAASAFSFSRGVLTGAVLALACLWPWAAAAPWSRRLGHAALCLLPALVAAGLIVVFASGNHQHLGGDRIWSIGGYSLWYFCLNPLHRLFEVDSWGPRTTIILGLAKVALIAWGLRHSTGRLRALLALLLAFDLGNSVLLGLGRYHTGLETVISSRYQYTSLVATLPFLGLWLESLGTRLPAGLRAAAAALALLLTAWFTAKSWPTEIAGFAASRGTYTRQLLFHEANPPAQGALPGISTMTTDRAKELIRRYDLH